MQVATHIFINEFESLANSDAFGRIRVLRCATVGGAPDAAHGGVHVGARDVSIASVPVHAVSPSTPAPDAQVDGSNLSMPHSNSQAL